jgi:nitrogen regulatory protein PII
MDTNPFLWRHGACQNIRVIKLVWLSENYQPIVKKIESPLQNVKTGDRAVFVFSRFK